MVKINSFLISITFLVSCSGAEITNKKTAEEVIQQFYKSSEYQQYKLSDGPFTTALVSLRIEEIDLNFVAKDGGEAEAFREFINNQTNFVIATNKISLN